MVLADSTLNMVEATNKTMTSRHRKRILARIAFSALAFAVLVVLMHGVHLVSPRSIETAIDQNLGPQSDLASVREFMDAHHIVYVGYSAQFHRAYGKVYRSSVGLMKGHIMIEFTFNDDGKLASHKVVELFQFAWE